MLNKRNSASKLPNSAEATTTKKIALAWLGLVILFIAMLAKQWLWSAQSPIETNILKLLPINQQDPVAEQAFESVTSNLSDKVVFVVTADKDEKTFAAASQLEQDLTQTGLFTEVVGKVSAAQQSQWAAYYFDHRYQQLTAEQRDRLANQPQAQIQYVLQSLYNPFSGVTGQELASDPFLLFRDYLSQLTQLSSAFVLDQGFLTTEFEGQKYILVSATLNDSPYSLTAQQGVTDILSIERSLAEKFGANTFHTGVLFYAQFGTESAKSEISTIGLFSLLGVIILVVGVFRSAAPLSLALLSIGVGLLSALALTTWIFGSVHLFSLVFGASLIGVSIDYAFHYLTERLAAGQKWDSRKGLKHIFTAITMGLITSLIGYLGMLIAPFPGLQQLALFSSIGLIAAYATVVAWYPVLAVKPSADRKLPGQWIWRPWLALWTKPVVKYGLPLTCLIAATLPLSNLHYDDDIRQLQAMPESLKQQEEFITQLSGLQSSQQMLVVTAANDEALLQRLEALDTQLKEWQREGKIQGYQSLSQYLSSTTRQEQNYQLIQDLYQQQDTLLRDTLKLSEVPRLSAPLSKVTLQEYLEHTVSEPVRFLYIGKIADKVAGVVILNELSQPEEIKAFANMHSDVSYLNKAEEISALFADYRIKVMELLIAALAVIALLLVKRYGFKHSIKILVPSLIACVAGLATASAVGSTLNLFNLLALILIIGIGIDYTLFFAEKARSQSTLLAITLSAMTTLLSFGLLSLSQTHAIHSFGITVLSGIFVAWLLSPLAIEERKPS
ncbi:MMPL family transporter [Vibrio europaeus]|uniref:MMPL family transporter n=1 Tax=Vibrio europaeus TaxID=300876 RepID=A0A178J8N6_9VIBR|nr:MMPL family transporter [Vibrio europaeus]MDC5705458.1 MMPL family transporter [Vibrio europaeus]MDC5710737.1 MMPL family transporter [Vibrio europaeus]MDC5715827.1 MMPL family transporter [Vibrio europaeus]MDC5719988.1 MMPL family transporter [Vibrio europaeus]MDC5724125.1 MMPL family transporter [Vibrio europaeus]